MSLVEFAVTTFAIIVGAGCIIALLLRIHPVRAVALAAAVYAVGGGLMSLIIVVAAVIA